MLKVRDIIPVDWRDVIASNGPCALGLDVATTTKAKSNPSSITLMQKVGLDYIARAIVRFKTKDPAVTEAVIREFLKLPHGLRMRRLCVDATSERFFAAALKTALAGDVITELLVMSEAMEYKGERMLWKAYLGNLLVNTAEDGHLVLPHPGTPNWLEKGLRQVMRANGTFTCEVDEDGNHGDDFDGLKLALHGLISTGGPAQAAAAQVGTMGGTAKAKWWKNPLAKAAAIVRRLC